MRKYRINKFFKNLQLLPSTEIETFSIYDAVKEYIASKFPVLKPDDYNLVLENTEILDGDST